VRLLVLSATNFQDFASVDEAKAVMDYPYRHMLELDNRSLLLEYARRDQRPPHPADSSAMPKPSKVGRCRLTVSQPELIARPVSVLGTKM